MSEDDSFLKWLDKVINELDGIHNYMKKENENDQDYSKYNESDKENNIGTNEGIDQETYKIGEQKMEKDSIRERKRNLRFNNNITKSLSNKEQISENDEQEKIFTEDDIQIFTLAFNLARFFEQLKERNS